MSGPYSGWTRFQEQVTKSDDSTAGGEIAMVFLILGTSLALGLILHAHLTP
jgi:hypothetical protein